MNAARVLHVLVTVHRLKYKDDVKVGIRPVER